MLGKIAVFLYSYVMKKFIVAILALVYITTSTGATLQMHYCMGQLTDWGLGQNKSKTCGKCGMDKSEEKDNGCCKDEHKFIKSNTDQKTVEAGFQFLHLIAVALPVYSVDIPTVNLSSVAEENPISHAPPRTCGVAVYILNRTFLI
ncbi:MAG: hypothetical protein FD136_1091 [Chitinophagaceae bacterium]|nr:MAG: hypothetical protein FD183_233 [Chitinophagaceae bacterium]TXT33103.1 MAG: hypothetical protein FD136_1091 [Chitinophagaceae bacterium]